MLGKIPATRLALIEKIVAHIAPRSTLGNKRYLSEFLRAYYRGVAEEDLRMRAPEVLAAAALEHLALGKRRPASQPLVKIVPARPGSSKLAAHRALVRIVTDDMPFLVDSLGIVFNQMNIAVHLIVHPVLNVIRDARGSLREISDERRAAATESWQMLEIDRPGDAARNAELLGRIEATLADVRAAVRDFKTMRARVQSVAANLDSARTAIAADEVAEARALLLWMEEQHFVFLGYRYYKLRRGAGHDVLQRDTASGLGILRGRISSERVSAPNVLRGKLRQQAREATLLVLTKANSVATVHRASYLDYVGVKSFDARGRVTGEHRFLGLWTSSVYHRTPSEVPLLRRKVDAVVEHFGLPAGSHDAKAVVNVIETFPRDELFQMTVGDLVRIVRGVVNLYERHQVRLFVRRDAYERFYSCLVYVPRDRYNTEVRNRIERIVRERFAGTHVETQVQISESTLARLHLLVRTAPGARAVQDFAPIEAAIAASAATWDDGLRAALVEARDEPAALELASRYAGAFPPAYRDDIEPQHALEDIADLEVVRQDAAALRLNLRLAAYQGKSTLHLKIIKAGEPIAISDILPMLENFGLRVTAERPYEIGHLQTSAWIQDFELQTHDAARLDLATVEPLFKEAFAATWRGAADNDGFNRLLLGAGLAAREILVLRAYGRYLLQTGAARSAAGASVSNAVPTRHRTGSPRAGGRTPRQFAPQVTRGRQEPGRRPHPAGLLDRSTSDAAY
jgi:glutamate dehydrogenase